MADEFVKGNFTISPIDGRGRIIAPEVLSVASEIRKNALAYAEKAIGDPAVAASLFEEAAAAVSRVFVRPTDGRATIHNLNAYLFRAFIRRLNRTKRREMRLVASFSRNSGESEQFDPSRELEMRILVNELLTRCDRVTRDMFYRRIAGFSWKEIGSAYGISAHAAESRFSQALRRLRQRLGLGGQK